MKLRSLIYTGIFIATIALLLKVNYDNNPGMCPYDENACYFTTGYLQSRSLFKEKAKQLNLTMHSKQIKNNYNNDLTIDIAVINEPKSKEQDTQPMLLHVSGTHGAEGYTGSAIQIALLDKIYKNEIQIPNNVTVVLVHALNPFGFYMNRRWNENGVDLNRNFMPDDTYPGELKHLTEIGTLSSYKELESLFNKDYKWLSPIDDIKFIFEFLYHILVAGFFEVKQALVSGQYYCASCIWYGGDKVQPSIQYIIDFLKQNYQNTDSAIFIDVHTGLGPEGIDTLISTSKSSSSVRQIFQNNSISDDIYDQTYYISDNLEDHLPFNLKIEDIKQEINLDATKTDVGNGYELLQGSSHNLLQSVGINKGVTVIQEFGTVAGVFILKALVQENSYWVNNATDEELTIGAQQVKSVFHRENIKYKNNVIRRGLVIIKQALIGLSDPKLSQNIPNKY